MGQENWDVWADLNSSNVLTARRVFGNGVDDLLARGTGAAMQWYNVDRKGSVRFLTSNAAAGTISGAMSYDGFGKPTGTGVDRYGYTGREYDVDTTTVAGTGLSFLRDRVLSNDLGRFNTRDRMGFDAGDVNLTRYVGNGYANASDPSGYQGFGGGSGGPPITSSPPAYHSSGSPLGIAQGGNYNGPNNGLLNPSKSWHSTGNPSGDTNGRIPYSETEKRLLEQLNKGNTSGLERQINDKDVEEFQRKSHAVFVQQSLNKYVDDSRKSFEHLIQEHLWAKERILKAAGKDTSKFKLLEFLKDPETQKAMGSQNSEAIQKAIYELKDEIIGVDIKTISSALEVSASTAKNGNSSSKSDIKHKIVVRFLLKNCENMLSQERQDAASPQKTTPGIYAVTPEQAEAWKKRENLRKELEDYNRKKNLFPDSVYPLGTPIDNWAYDLTIRYNELNGGTDYVTRALQLLDVIKASRFYSPSNLRPGQPRVTEPHATASPYAHLRPGWSKHIDSVVDDLVASGRPKTMVLGEGGQRDIVRFVNREPSKMSEFLEYRPNSLDYSAHKKAGTFTPAMDAETLEFNLLLIERLHQRGFTFKVIGVDSSTAATSTWLKAELEVLERLGVKWEVIPKTKVEDIMKLDPWRRKQ